MPKTIIFTSSNKAKIARYKPYIEEFGYIFKSLLDFESELASPAETGNNEQENAEIKAKYYWEILNHHQNLENTLILSEDSGMNLKGVSEIDNPKKDIKQPILEKFGELKPEYFIQYYSDLARKYGGKLELDWIFGFAVFDGKTLESVSIITPSYLVDRPKLPIDDFYPLNSLLTVLNNGNEIYLADLTKIQWKEIWDVDLIHSLKHFLGKL